MTLASKEQVPTNTREIELGQRFIAASSRAGMILGTLCGASYALIDDINEDQNGNDQKVERPLAGAGEEAWDEGAR
ncbi:hypothetical protein [Rhizobium ruizarguesonis]|uniref:hypothetical protein n=1 Tax=Rhizobium ruizarguesonis TaxID=2081791 RepID=UPI00102F45A3|nr:hypothetical protein [Rhizobium ruizarguesonis]TAZ67166.1 hypothetical protein ELH68_35590 [Rhizobium ruizarguesonis]